MSLYCITGDISTNGGDGTGYGGGGAGGRIALYLNHNDTYLGKFHSYGGDATYHPNYPGEPGGPGTVFIYHQIEQHTTLYISNNGLVSHRKNNEGTNDPATGDHHVITDYADLSRDGYKAWILSQSGQHWLAENNHEYK